MKRRLCRLAAVVLVVSVLVSLAVCFASGFYGGMGQVFERSTRASSYQVAFGVTGRAVVDESNIAAYNAGRIVHWYSLPKSTKERMDQ